MCDKLNQSSNMSNKSSSAFALLCGATLGAAAGLVAGLLVAPKVDENSKNEIEQAITKFYEKAKKQVEEKVETLRLVGSRIDQVKYKKLVEDVVDELKASGEVTAKVASKLGAQLKSDWELAQKEFAGTPFAKAKTTKAKSK